MKNQKRIKQPNKEENQKPKKQIIQVKLTKINKKPKAYKTKNMNKHKMWMKQGGKQTNKKQ